MYHYAMCPGCRSRDDWYFESQYAQERNLWAASHSERTGHRALTFGRATTSFKPHGKVTVNA